MFERFLQRFRGHHAASLPGYTPIGVIREGSMSTVFKARDQETGQLVAVKVHKAAVSKPPEKTAAPPRGLTEGEILSLLDHPNVVKCYDHGDLGGMPYVVMEYLEGATLAMLVLGASRRLEGRRLSCLRQAAAAIAHTHSRRLIHHDVCPKNLFVTADDCVKLIDFGLATAVLEAPCGTGRTGTVEMLAPEVLKREPCDCRVDVFAWGVVAYQLLSGHWPFESPEHHQTLNKILNVHPLPLEKRVPNLPTDVAHVVMRCLEKDPSKRLGSLTTAVGALERCQDVAL